MSMLGSPGPIDSVNQGYGGITPPPTPKDFSQDGAYGAGGPGGGGAGPPPDSQSTSTGAIPDSQSASGSAAAPTAPQTVDQANADSKRATTAMAKLQGSGAAAKMDPYNAKWDTATQSWGDTPPTTAPTTVADANRESLDANTKLSKIQLAGGNPMDYTWSNAQDNWENTGPGSAPTADGPPVNATGMTRVAFADGGAVEGDDGGLQQ